MKNTLLFAFLFCLAGFITSAQTVSIYPKVLHGSGSNSGSQDYITTVSNNMSNVNDTMFRWEILKYNPPSNWLMSFCSPYECIGIIAVGSNGTFFISKGKNGQMHITYTFSNTPGSDTLIVKIQSVLSPLYADTFTLITNSWMTGVNEVSSSNQISFYPNPVNDILNIKFAAITSSPVIDIYNIIGVKVKTVLYNTNSSSINVSDLKNGMYILRISDGNKNYSKTFNKTE